MSFYSKVLTGLAVTLVAGLAAVQPGIALPEQPNTLLLSQENKPPEEGVPQLRTEEVRGRITRIGDDDVEVRLADGELRTYNLSEVDEETADLEVGQDVVLSVRGDDVIAIGPSTGTSESATSGSVSGGTSQSSSSSSSSTVIRRETTVQQSQARPAPAPAPRPAAAPQPVRGLW